MSKRATIAVESNELKKLKDANSLLDSNYNGFKVLEDGIELDTIPIPKTPTEIRQFYNEYVKKRKPCRFSERVDSFDWDLLKPENIKNLLDNTTLQIEKKTDGGFGSGSKRLAMDFYDFLDSLGAGNYDLYLTTQYAEHEVIDKCPKNQNTDEGSEEEIEGEEEKEEEEDDDEEEETGVYAFPDNASDVSSTDSINFNDLHDDFEEMEEEDEGFEDLSYLVKELYQPPLDTLISSIPEQLPFLKLIPQQINLWIGAAKEQEDNQAFLKDFDPDDKKLGLGRNVPGGGSSSGLHHDHADNIYIPIKGHKRFTLFAPSDVSKMYTVGDVDELYDTGIINYKRNEKSPQWNKLRRDGAIETLYAEHRLEDPNISEEERKIMENILNDDNANQKDLSSSENVNHLDPPSFSTIPPTVVHLDKVVDEVTRKNIEKVSRKKWPEFFNAHRITVDLKPGEMLYLPTGWFHEVTSFGFREPSEDSSDIHVAVNYWLMPPTGDSIESMYSDDYWQTYFQSVSNALKEARRGAH